MKDAPSPFEAAPPSGRRALPTPEPMPDLATYERERDLCLAADPRRKANYERYLASARRQARVDYLPIKLDIENVSRCNLHCTMCQVSGWPKSKRAEDSEPRRLPPSHRRLLWARRDQAAGNG